MGKYQSMREIIRETMRDGKAHTAEELEKIFEKNGIYLRNNRGPIYNVVHQLKQKGEIVSDGENGYILSMNAVPNVKTSNQCILLNDSQLDLTDFEVVRPSIRRRTKQVISVFENADVAINEAMSKMLVAKEFEMRIKKDCRQLLIIPNGEEKIEVGKNKRFKNYEIYEKLKKNKIKLPAYYVGEWSEDKMFWLGYLTTVNPNKTNSNGMK